MDFTQGIIGPQGHVDALRHSLWLTLELSSPGTNSVPLPTIAFLMLGEVYTSSFPQRREPGPIRIPPREEHPAEPSSNREASYSIAARREPRPPVLSVIQQVGNVPGNYGGFLPPRE